MDKKYFTFKVNVSDQAREMLDYFKRQGIPPEQILRKAITLYHTSEKKELN